MPTHPSEHRRAPVDSYRGCRPGSSVRLNQLVGVDGATDRAPGLELVGRELACRATVVVVADVDPLHGGVRGALVAAGVAPVVHGVDGTGWWRRDRRCREWNTGCGRF